MACNMTTIDAPQRTEEEWRDIPSAPNYQASSLGRIRSVYFNNRWVKNRYRPKVLSQSTVGGYKQVSISSHNKARSALVHRLVCEAFHGPCPRDKDECAHNNGVKSDNDSGNLRWATFSENQLDRHLHGTACRGEQNAHSKLTLAKVRDIRSRKARGENRRVLAAEFGVCPELVDKIAGRRVWKWVA